MAGIVRRQMVEGAARLLAEKGLQATSFSEVLELTGAPRGSVYHHFPEGKNQMVASALEFTATRMDAYLDAKEGSSAAEVTEYFLFLWRELLTRTDFSVGCAVLAVAVATDSPGLLDDAAAIFRQWRTRLARMLEAGGLAPDAASRFAATLVAASEGAVVMSRAERNIAPFDAVAGFLREQVHALQAG